MAGWSAISLAPSPQKITEVAVLDHFSHHQCRVQKLTGKSWSEVKFDDLRPGDVMRMCSGGQVYTDEEGFTEFKVVKPQIPDIGMSALHIVPILNT